MCNTHLQVPSRHEEEVAFSSPPIPSGLLVPHPAEHCEVDSAFRKQELKC